ncbi:MAG: NAD(P)-binding domain-containing protein [Gemmatimonadota bacterium]|nr:NAD(P)-binding domain-containing protein [Gemmatimonadota bacterium]
MSVPVEKTARVCVVGAGPSGITAAKNLLDAGYTNLVVYDRGADVGGNWVFDAESGHSSVFETTHIISSRRFSQYDDYPMPEEYPDYPGHRELAAYFQGYARHFGVYPFVRFGVTVERCVRRPTGGWDVTVREGGVERTEAADQLVVCNGHHWEPRRPDHPGTFTGEYLHSHDFKRAEPFRGKRVLVIGGGNSGCDCAVETSRVSARTDLSWRRGYWVVPKFIFGFPGDVIHNWATHRLGWIPWSVRRTAIEWMLRLVNGPAKAYGLPEPDHHFGEAHPTVNSELLYFLRHGKIHPRPDVARFDGRAVHFVDGTSGEYDAIIACTGFVIRHPFFDRDVVDYSEGPVPLHLRMIHPEHDDLHFIGLVQPLGCIWPLAELQAKIMARRFTGAWRAPADLAAAAAREASHPDVRQISSPRHTITVDYPRFRKRLLRELPRDYVSTDPVPTDPVTPGG